MSRHCRDPRVWLPFAIAALFFGWRERTAAPAPPITARSRATELPAMHGLAPAAGEQSFELDADKSSIRFLVEGPRGELLARCAGAAGHLRLNAGSHSGELELRFDLASLQTIGGGEGTLDVLHVLGVHRGGEVVYRARLVASTTSDLPGIEERTWLGALQFGSRVQQEPMRLWQCSLPGRPLRLQGHGSVPAADYGLPRRWLLGLFEERHIVTLGLDLAWRRNRDH